MASAEELRQLIQETVRAVMAGMQGSGQATSGSGGNQTRRTLDPKGVTRVDSFCGRGTVEGMVLPTEGGS